MIACLDTVEEIVKPLIGVFISPVKMVEFAVTMTMYNACLHLFDQILFFIIYRRHTLFNNFFLSKKLLSEAVVPKLFY